MKNKKRYKKSRGQYDGKDACSAATAPDTQPCERIDTGKPQDIGELDNPILD